MDAINRKKLIKKIKNKQADYLSKIDIDETKINIENRFKKLTGLIARLLRREKASSNGIKSIYSLSKVIFGLSEDFIRLKLLAYSFEYELEILNSYIIDIVESYRISNYHGKTASYAETLLNIYLDLYITLTVKDVTKRLEEYPSFLINPLTGSNLELDVTFEDFKLSFEMQGEHHYTLPNVIAKDIVKRTLTLANNRVLVPVNVFQINHLKLSNLITNSIKDFYNFHNNIVNKTNPSVMEKKGLLSFLKLTQRIILADKVFKPALDYIDRFAEDYRRREEIKGRIVTTTTNAPRQITNISDLDIHYIYKNMRFLKKKEPIKNNAISDDI